MIPPRRLPINVPPARHELLVSYLARLADLHGMTYQAIWRLVSDDVIGTNGRRPLVADRVAHLTGRTRAELGWALPELRDPPPDWWLFRHEPQPACPACTARHPGGPVFVILPHHRYVCTRHGYWIGPPDTALPAPGLHRLPEIITAQHRHHRLLRRYGWPATYDAILTAFMICGWYWDKLQRRPEPSLTADMFDTWTSRTTIMIPPDAIFATFTTSKLFAAIYPEAVTIAPLIASPHWRAEATGTIDQKRHFVSEIGRRMHSPGYRPKTVDDPITHWMEADASRPPSAPPKIFPAVRGFSQPQTLTSHYDGKLGKRSTSAVWFSRNHKGGNTLLHHRHIRPVLIREWSTPMAEFEGAIFASQYFASQYLPQPYIPPWP